MNKSMFVIFFTACFMMCCSAKSDSADFASSPAIVSNDVDLEESVVLKEVEIPSSLSIIPDRNNKLDIGKLKISSGDVYNDLYIGKVVSEELINIKNIVIQEKIGTRDFGPIDGIEDSKLRFGWNNRNRVLFFELIDSSIKFDCGLGLGSEIRDVLLELGNPNSAGDNWVRYQNIDFELIGVMFYYDVKGFVNKIIVFSYT